MHTFFSYVPYPATDCLGNVGYRSALADYARHRMRSAHKSRRRIPNVYGRV
jgi:hypothetical protein